MQREVILADATADEAETKRVSLEDETGLRWNAVRMDDGYHLWVDNEDEPS